MFRVPMAAVSSTKIRTIAREVWLSLITVSHALRGAPNVAAATRSHGLSHNHPHGWFDKSFWTKMK